VLFFDLDKFKPINDTFGHEVGDVCLKTVAEAMRVKSRKSDVPVRLGGDEFVLILSNTTLEKSRAHIDELFSYINSLSVPTSEGFAKINTSVGIAEYGANDTLESVLNRADEDLYTNKQMRKAAESAREMTQAVAAPRV
jgi:diguanylate cyclase (GGDEF)-like protein